MTDVPTILKLVGWTAFYMAGTSVMKVLIVSFKLIQDTIPNKIHFIS